MIKIYQITILLLNHLNKINLYLKKIDLIIYYTNLNTVYQYNIIQK